MKPRLLLAAVTLGLAAHAVASLDGTWRLDLPRRGGVTLHTFLHLHQNGATFDGTVIINDCVELKALNPHWDGTTAVFRTDWGSEFRVRAVDGKLTAHIDYGGGANEDVLGVRVPDAAAAARAALPVPPARDVPANGLALTPPMGWNSWNHFADKVDDATVRATADALVRSGMAAAGYTYLNIDDTWEGGRDPAGTMVTNAKFPDMKALADYVHARGLKLGIYSSPGPTTCGGYEGSFGHEEQDARTFASWGIDYLKYDWCSAGRIYREDALIPLYQKMGRALQATGRPIVFSLCEYGMGDVWKWGPRVGGNLWRTTGDIQDHWESMAAIGFDQGRLAPYAGPGHWNDPDMLEVGNGGMTAVEYRTHFSLWCLLAAPLMAGNDLRTMSDDTRDILTNREVIALDQDPLGRQATRIAEKDGVEVWAKPLQDGATGVGIFNRNATDRTVAFSWAELGVAAPKSARDLWLHREVPTGAAGPGGTVAAHGVLLLRLR